MIVVRAFVVIVAHLSREHRLDHAGSLGCILVLLRIVLDDTIRVIPLNININVDFLIEADVGIVDNEDVELEEANATKALLHFKLGHVAILSMYTFNLHNVLSCLRIGDNYVPLVLL